MSNEKIKSAPGGARSTSGTTQDSGKQSEGKSTTVKSWMPIWIGDYLADTGRLTTEQHGAFILLLMDYWRSGPPQDDDASLAQITKLTVGRWKKHRPTLSRFFRVEDGQWNNKRLDEELHKAQEFKAMAVKRAKHAARKRWEGGSNA